MMRRVIAAYDGLLRGDLEGALEARAIAETPGLEALESAIALAHPPSAGPAIDLALVARSASRAPELAARALANALRAAMLSFDRARVDDAASRLEEVASTHEEARAWRQLGAGWCAVLDGAPSAHEVSFTIDVAQRLGRAELLIEARALEALILAERGDITEALAAARRASRMSRTESMPQSEYLANLVLARVRRFDGKPHLAARILRALYAVAPSPWLPWLAWELALASGGAPALAIGVAGAKVPLALGALLDRAWAGDRAGFDRATANARSACAGFAPQRADLERVIAAIDPRADVEPVGGWTRGEVAEPPMGLIGIVRESEVESAYVSTRGDGRARRILAPGVALARADGAQMSAAGEEKQLRTDSAIAAIALAGPEGVGDDALFQRLYGFAYEPERHASVRDVLFGRARKRAAPASIEREAGVVRLSCVEPRLFPDPRCSPAAELKILRVLGQRKAALAKDIAEELGVSLRTAQDALARLAEDGALRKEKARAGLHYVLEDTTFSEPTRNVRAPK